jgi:glycosyltransferase involved in cell wall biosynthesis
MGRPRVGHIVFPRPSALRPVSEFQWQAVESLFDDPNVDPSVWMPVPSSLLRPLHGWIQRVRGRSHFSPALIDRLRSLRPAPTLVPYCPVPGRSIESAAWALARALSSVSLDVVQGSFLDEAGFVASVIAKEGGAKALVVGHGTDVRVARRSSPANHGRCFRSRFSLRYAQAVAVVSQQLAQDVAALGRASTVIPFTSRASEFPLGAERERKDEILFVGRVSQSKGVHELLQALAMGVPEPIKLRLVGPADPGLHLDRSIRALGLAHRVILTGELSKGELARHYQTARCLVLPSWAEGLPCVVVEALLCGCPVVATAVGGIPELVDEQVGKLVRPRDPAALATAICEVEANQRAGRYDPQTLRRRAEPFGWERGEERLARLTRTLLEGPLGSASVFG